MTTGSFNRLTRLRLTFNALMAERFVRRSLLREFTDLAAESPGCEEVSNAAALLLSAVEAGIDTREFEQRARDIGAGLASLESATASAKGH
jgi:hypothetical protein